MSAGVGLSFLALLVLEGRAAAQSSDPVRPDNDVGGQLLSVISLASQPDLTASRLESEDGGRDEIDRRIDILRLVGELTPTLYGTPLYLEGGVGFGRSRLSFPADGRPTPDETRFDSIAAIGGIGPSIELTEFTFLRPQALLGFGYTDNSFDLPILEEPERSTQLDLRQWSIAGGLALSLDYEAPVGDDIVDARLRASQLFLNTIWAANNDLSANASNQTVTGTVVYKLNTGWQPYEMPFYLTGLVAGNGFFGDQSEALGFNHYFEYGAGIEFDTRGKDWWVKTVRLRGAGIIGRGVTGFSVGGGIGFQ